jgi:hypothetical protein
MTFVLSAATPPARADLMASAKVTTGGAVAEKTHVSVGENFFNGLNESFRLQTTPRSHRLIRNVESVSDGKAFIRNVDTAGLQPTGYLVGGQCYAGRIVDDEWVDLGSAVITACDLKFFWRPPEFTSTERLASTESSFSISFATFNKPSSTYYVGIAAVGADGRISAFTSGEAITSPATITSDVQSNVTSTDINVNDTDIDAGLAVPTNLSGSTSDGGNTWDFTFTQSSGAQGYIVRVSESADVVNDGYIETSLSLQAGDYVVLSKKIDSDVGKSDMVSKRVWNANVNNQYGPFGQRSPIWPDEISGLSYEYSEENGIPFVRITNSTGSPYTIFRFTHGGFDSQASTNPSFYYPLEPGVTYRNEWVARSSNSATVQTRVSEIANGAVGTAETMTSDWATYNHDFSNTVLDQSSSASSVSLVISSGGIVDIREWHTFDSRYSKYGLHGKMQQYADMTGSVRDHRMIKTQPVSYDAKSLCQDPNSLLLFLNWAKSSGCTEIRPQFDYHMSAAEIAQIMEYFCASYDPSVDTPAAKPFAYIRYQQGQAAPWQDVFDKIILEWGNENWNGLSAFFRMPDVSGQTRGKSHALLINWIAGRMRAHPDFAANKWALYVGAGRNQTQFTTDLINNLDTGLDTRSGFADYRGGWDNDDSEVPDPASDADWYTLVFNNELTRNKTRRQNAIDFVSLCAANNVKCETYEAGQGYPLPNTTINTSEKLRQSEAFNKSAGSGAQTLASWLMNCAHGVTSQNYFTLGNGNNGAYFQSHSAWVIGGHLCPSTAWVLSFWNEHIEGSTVREITAFVESEKAALNSTYRSVEGYIATHSERGAYLVLHNRDHEASRAIRVTDLPSGDVTRYFCTGTYLSHNTTIATAGDALLDSEQLSEIDGTLTRTIPAGMAEVYQIT